MIRAAMLVGLVFSITGLAHASLDDNATYEDQASITEAGNEYMVACTDEGMADGLSGDELDAYVQDCMDNTHATHQESTGDDS